MDDVEEDKLENAEIPDPQGASSAVETAPDIRIHKREKWAKKLDFLVACIGFSVGLGNVWRFPFLCYKNGGGAFLIPYFIAVFLGGIPMFFLEVALGQFMGEGGIGPWRIAPLFQGIGYATAMIVFLLNCEYNIILTWTFYYIFSSFTSVLPWSHCNNQWNTANCTTFDELRSLHGNHTLANVSGMVSGANSPSFMTSGLIGNSSKKNFSDTSRIFPDPVTEFWERKVLGLSAGIDEPGSVKWDLALCLLLAWVIVYLCICKGIKTSGKVVYFTATSPYIFMFILLGRGVTLPGAETGMKYYVTPNWTRLNDPEVWVDAGTQIFFSYSISLGTLVALGSYNKFHQNCFRDSLIFAAVNTFTSFLAGFVIFSVLGFMAQKQNLPIEEVAESGPGLAFIAYPEAVAQMPFAPLWSVLFFIMIILLGLDSQFVGVEGFITACVDLYPRILRRNHRKEIFIAVVCAICYLIGLSMVTEGGMYVFQLFDYYSASKIILVVSAIESLVVAHVYGIHRFCDNLVIMLGFQRKSFVKMFRWIFTLCWSFLTPGYSLAIFIVSLANYSELTYKRKFVLYEYPLWAIGIGWTLALSSVVLIPVFMVQRMIITPGSFKKRLQKLLTPHLQQHQLRPNEDMTRTILEEHTIYESSGDSNDNHKHIRRKFQSKEKVNSGQDILLSDCQNGNNIQLQ